jgi:hypothetical protein
MGEDVSFLHFVSYRKKMEAKLAHPTFSKEKSTEQAIKLLIKVARKIQLHQPNSPRYFAADVHRISLKNFNNFLIKKIR